MREAGTTSVRLVFAGLFITLLLSQIPVGSAAYTVAVKTGDWIKYGNITALPTGVTQLGEVDFNQTDSVRCDALSVSGTEVTMQATVQFKNGSPGETETLKTDVATGSGNLSLFIIPSGLKKGDTIPIPSGDLTFPFAVKINDTVTRTYAGASRSVNVFDFSISVLSFTESMTLYWDQSTGVLVDLSIYISGFGPTTQLKFNATETNMWSSSPANDFTTLIMDNLIYVIGIIVAVVIIVAGVITMRRRRQASAPTPTPSTWAPAEEKPQ